MKSSICLGHRLTGRIDDARWWHSRDTERALTLQRSSTRTERQLDPFSTTLARLAGLPLLAPTRSRGQRARKSPAAGRECMVDVETPAPSAANAGWPVAGSRFETRPALPIDVSPCTHGRNAAALVRVAPWASLYRTNTPVLRWRALWIPVFSGVRRRLQVHERSSGYIPFCTLKPATGRAKIRQAGEGRSLLGVLASGGHSIFRLSEEGLFRWKDWWPWEPFLC
jgi:hypothetical protein